MSDENQLPSDSDSDDEDYVPDTAECASDKSEISEDDDATEANSEDENRSTKPHSKVKKKSKNRKKTGKSAAKIETNSKETSVIEQGKSEEEKREDEKKKADSLWADFLKDTGTIKRTAPGPSSSASNTNSESPPAKIRAVEKVKVTEVFHFAGEEVKVEKEVLTETVKTVLTTSTNANEKLTNVKSADTSSNRPKRGGINSVLGMLGKKNKISTLEKSKLDWENFKKEENLEEEIVTFNRGKNGYLERQDFLQRADLRQFEIEKQMRSSTRRSAR